jgi:protein O-GlcNAc transferase
VRVVEQMITESLVNLEAAQTYFKKANWLKESGQLDSAIENYKKALSFNPEDAEIYQKMAEVYLLKRQLDSAITACELALKINPDFAPAYLTMGNTWQSQDQLEMAIKAYSQALEIDPKFAEAHANLGSMYYKLGRLVAAVNSYKKAIANNPNLASVFLMLGNVLQQQGNLNDAIFYYQKLLELQPKGVKNYYKLGEALAKNNDFDTAIDCYQKVLRLQPEDNEAKTKLSSLQQLNLQKKQDKGVIKSATKDQFLELEKEGEGQPPASVKQDEEHGLQPSSINLQQLAQESNLNPPLDNGDETREPVSNFNFNAPEQVAKFPEVEEYKKRAEAYLLQGNFKEAIAFCQLALKIKPDFANAYVTLGNTLQAQGKMDAAIRAYEKALEFQPNYAEVYANIGSMYFKMERLEASIFYYQKAITIRPDLAGIHWNLGKAFQKQGKSQEAIACFQKTSELNPHLVGADFHFNLANTLLNEGKRDEAILSYERAIAVKPDWAEAYANIGSARMQQGLMQEAVEYYQKAIAIKPELKMLHFNIANTFLNQGNYEQAISNYQEAIKHNPEWSDAIANLGNAFSMQGKLEEAIATYQQALVCKPDWAEVYCRMGHIQKQDRPLEAIGYFEKAIELNPYFSEAHQQLCDLLSHSSNLAGARKVADKYCEYCAESVPVMSATAYVFSYLQSGVSELALQKLVEIEKLSYQKCETFSVIDIKLLYEIFIFAVSHLRDDREANANFYKLIAEQYYGKAVTKRQINRQLKPSNYPIQPRPLRIGFLSKHFRRHSVGWCSEALIRELTYITPHVHLYVTGKLQNDEVTTRFEEMAGKFYWPKKYPNGFADGGEILEEVLQDNLDILVDLDSMTVPTNVEVLYHSPAPVCVTWLGFDAPYLSDKHYFLCDQYTHPAGVDKHYIEQLVRLPECSVAISGLQSVSVDRNGLRKSLGIGLDQLTYLCVAPGRKTNPEMLRSQVKILKEVPDSLLVRKGQGDPDVIHASYRQECEAQGVDFNRIKFLGQTKTEEEHRAIYYVADVMLDSYPYNGGTHNLEALWANLPVVTRAGNQYLSRMGYAFLKSVNLDVGVAWNWEEYTQWGIKYGRDAAFRNGVREHLIRSKEPEHLAPLWNPKKLANDMYQVFQNLLAKQIQ